MGLLTGVTIVLIYTQCVPYYALWKLEMVVAGEARCVDLKQVNSYDIAVSGKSLLRSSLVIIIHLQRHLTHPACFAASDFALAILAINLVWGLQLSLKKRLTLSGLLGGGFMYVLSFCLPIVRKRLQ